MGSGTAGTIGSGDVTWGVRARESNSFTRRVSWRTASLNLCNSTAPATSRAIGTRTATSPRQTNESIKIAC